MTAGGRCGRPRRVQAERTPGGLRKECIVISGFWVAIRKGDLRLAGAVLLKSGTVQVHIWEQTPAYGETVIGTTVLELALRGAE